MAAQQPPSAPLSLLVIEDDPDHAALLQRVVRKIEGWQVAAHTTGLKEGLALARVQRFDAIVLDLNLGDTRGIETVRAAEPEKLSAPIIVLSALSSEGAEDEALRIGAEDYLGKEEVDASSLGRALRHARARFEMRRTLRRRNADIETFTIAAAHDMRSPLRHILSFAQLHKGCAPDKNCRCEERIETAALRLSDVLEGLSGYVRLGLTDPVWTDVDLSAVARETVQFLEHEIQQASASVAIEPLPTLRGDASLLSTLLRNLVANAVRHRSQGVEPSVRIGAVELENHWRIEVADNGTGVPEAYRDVVFQPFKRTPDTRPEEGAGLGLAICSRVAEHHGGEIGVEDNPGGGALFWCTLTSSAEARRA